MPKPEIDASKCTKCNTCVDTCPMDCFEAVDGDVPKVTKPEECVGCRACEAQCPAECIKVE